MDECKPLPAAPSSVRSSLRPSIPWPSHPVAGVPAELSRRCAGITRAGSVRIGCPSLRPGIIHVYTEDGAVTSPNTRTRNIT